MYMYLVTSINKFEKKMALLICIFSKMCMKNNEEL